MQLEMHSFHYYPPSFVWYDEGLFRKRYPFSKNRYLEYSQNALAITNHQISKLEEKISVSCPTNPWICVVVGLLALVFIKSLKIDTKFEKWNKKRQRRTDMKHIEKHPDLYKYRMEAMMKARQIQQEENEAKTRVLPVKPVTEPKKIYGRETLFWRIMGSMSYRYNSM